MIVAHVFGRRVRTSTIVCVAASAVLAACSPRATADPRGTSAAPDTAASSSRAQRCELRSSCPRSSTWNTTPPSSLVRPASWTR